MRGRKPAAILAGADTVTIGNPPAWLSKDAKAEWRRIMPVLVERRTVTEADMGSVESYCVSIGRVRELERAIQAGDGEILLKLMRAQDKAIVTSRQLAAELGLTPVSRSRPAIRDESHDDELAGLDL